MTLVVKKMAGLAVTIMWPAVLALYEEQCAINVGRTTCKVRVAGKHSVISPARSIRIIPDSVTVAAGRQI